MADSIAPTIGVYYFLSHSGTLKTSIQGGRSDTGPPAHLHPSGMATEGLMVDAKVIQGFITHSPLPNNEKSEFILGKSKIT